MQNNRFDIQGGFKLEGFWKFVRYSISADRELLLYFALYSAAQLIPFSIGYRILSSMDGKLIPGPIVVSLAILMFFSGAFSIIFSFAISFTAVERYRGRNATPSSTVGFLGKRWRLITKLIFAAFALDILEMTVAAIIDGIFKRSRPASKFLTSMLFAGSSLAKNVFLGFLIPVAVVTGQDDLALLGKQTTKLVKDNLLSTISINLKIGFFMVFWLAALIFIVTVLPDYAVGTNLVRNSFFLLMYSLIPIGQFIRLCMSLVYSRTVAMALEGREHGDVLRSELVRMGAKPNSFA